MTPKENLNADLMGLPVMQLSTTPTELRTEFRRNDSQNTTMHSVMVQHKILENDISCTSETPKEPREYKQFVSKIVFH